jgi:hypothetical protein
MVNAFLRLVYGYDNVIFQFPGHARFEKMKKDKIPPKGLLTACFPFDPSVKFLVNLPDNFFVDLSQVDLGAFGRFHELGMIKIGLIRFTI